MFPGLSVSGLLNRLPSCNFGSWIYPVTLLAFYSVTLVIQLIYKTQSSNKLCLRSIMFPGITSYFPSGKMKTLLKHKNMFPNALSYTVIQINANKI